MATLPITQTASPFRFLTLDEAALETGYTKDNLLKRAKEGRILAGMFDGTLRVAVTENGELVEIAPLPQNGNEDDINARLRQIRREDFAHLEGVKITVSEAEQRYGINRRTIIAWKQRGYIKTLKTGYRMELNEADVAYCA
ncbi:MAG TPA: hypothetical protein G4O04_10230, partial [Anaerolineae bacterium]|nr:hypothetical protein [Anaerolineae bacterium]